MVPIILCVLAGTMKVEDEATGVVLADDLNVRLNPSPGAAVIAELRKGDRVNVRGFRNGFYEIDPPPGVAYYVAKSYVSAEGRTEGTNVRVRSAPSLAPSLIQTELPRGSTVEIVGEKDEWWKVRPTRGCRAYVSTRFIGLPEGVLVPGEPSPSPSPDGPAKGPHSAGASLLEELRTPEAEVVGGRRLSMELSSPQGRLLRAEKIAALEKRRGRRADLIGAFLLYHDIALSETSPAADRALALQRLHELANLLGSRGVAGVLALASRAGKDLDALARSIPGLSAVEGVVLRRDGGGEWTHGLRSGLALRGKSFDLDALAGLRAKLWGRKENSGMTVYWGSSVP